MNQDRRERWGYVAAGLMGMLLNLFHAHRHGVQLWPFPWPRGILTANSAVIVCAGACAAWGIASEQRILDRRVRKLLKWLSLCMLLYGYIQFSRYEFFKPESLVFLKRYGRYVYFIPSLLMPTLLFLAARTSSWPERRLRPLAMVLLAVAGALIALILTNDLHHLAFRPRPGDEANYDRAYYGPLAVLAVAWEWALLLGALGMLLRAAWPYVPRRRLWLPVVTLFAGAVMLTLQMVTTNLLFDKLIRTTQLYCGMIIAFVESCVVIGLMPSNSGYLSLFEAASVSAQIMDRQGRVALRSRTALDLPPETLSGAVAGPIQLDANTRLTGQAIDGGYVYWTDDIGDMLRTHRQLEEVSRQLEEERALVQAENELRQERGRIETQRRIYDEIARDTAPQLQRLSALAEHAREHPEAREDDMRWATVLLAYVKRRANLALLGEQSSSLPASELRLSLEESLRGLKDCGVAALMSGQGARTLDKGTALLLFDFYEAAIEAAMPELSGLIVLMEGEGGAPVLRLQLGTPAAEVDLAAWQGRLDACGVRAECRTAEDLVCFTLFLPSGEAR